MVLIIVLLLVQATSTGDLHVLPNENAERAYVIDEQLNESGVQHGVDIHQHEDEARRRKMELEAEERKLEETLEYQRRIEDEAKQRHLAEQYKNNSRMTPLNKLAVDVSDVYKKYTIGNHVEEESSRLVSIFVMMLIKAHVNLFLFSQVRLEVVAF